MKIFVNTSGASVSTRKPMLDGRIVGGTTTTIQNHPSQVWPLHYFSVLRYFEVSEQKRPPVFVMTTSYASKLIKKKYKENKVWLFAAAEVSLTEQKKTGDSVVLFVASSTASQFHFT
jgi:hypothetical protein